MYLSTCVCVDLLLLSEAIAAHIIKYDKSKHLFCRSLRLLQVFALEYNMYAVFGSHSTINSNSLEFSNLMCALF